MFVSNSGISGMTVGSVVAGAVVAGAVVAGAVVAGVVLGVVSGILLLLHPQPAAARANMTAIVMMPILFMFFLLFYDTEVVFPHQKKIHR